MTQRNKDAEPGKLHNFKHGETRFNSPEYAAWQNMKLRCYYSKHVRYKYYGGRGIQVCERWKNSYTAFLEDMGRKPNNDFSLDRINNDGNYEPDNCRWATKEQQQLNRRPYGRAA